jgi:hypothetical protein
VTAAKAGGETEIEDSMSKSNDELAGRVLVLEAFVMAAIAGYVRVGGPNASRLPAERIIPILNGVKGAVKNRMADEREQVSAACREEANQYLDYLTSHFSEEVIPKS